MVNEGRTYALAVIALAKRRVNFIICADDLSAGAGIADVVDREDYVEFRVGNWHMQSSQVREASARLPLSLHLVRVPSCSKPWWKTEMRVVLMVCSLEKVTPPGVGGHAVPTRPPITLGSGRPR